MIKLKEVKKRICMYLELMSELNGEGEFTNMIILINDSIRKIDLSA